MTVPMHYRPSKIDVDLKERHGVTDNNDDGIDRRRYLLVARDS